MLSLGQTNHLTWIIFKLPSISQPPNAELQNYLNSLFRIFFFKFSIFYYVDLKVVKLFFKDIWYATASRWFGDDLLNKIISIIPPPKDLNFNSFIRIFLFGDIFKMFYSLRIVDWNFQLCRFDQKWIHRLPSENWICWKKYYVNQSDTKIAENLN